MLKRSLGLLALVPFLLLILAHRSSSPALLKDSDTGFLLLKIRERGAPLSWFGGDWPLGNHFYRPVATLAFEIDNDLYGDRAAGYGLTNALIIVACVIALYTLLRRFFPMMGAWAGSALFALWAVGAVPTLGLVVDALMIGAIVLGARARQGFRGLFVALGIAGLGVEFGGIESLAGTTLDWLPGRTATICTLFALLALASYAASIALGAEPREPRTVLPTDPPATRNTVVRMQRPGVANTLFALSLASTFLSLASYEQGVMIPALIFGVGLLMSPTHRVRFGAQALHWGVLVGYLVLRAQIVPVAPSGYQRQVLRFNPVSVLNSLLDYVSPGLGTVQRGYFALTNGFASVFDVSLWSGLFALFAFLALWTVVDARSRRPMAIWAAMSLLAFLPMAFVKHFEHYHFLPMALRTGFVVSATIGLAEALRRAATPRSLPTAPRSRPAPGSLPHL